MVARALILSAIAGFAITRPLSKRVTDKRGYLYVKDKHIHHYLLLIPAIFATNPIVKGVLLGAGLDDIKDLKDDAKNLFDR